MLRHGQAHELILVSVDGNWSAAHPLLRCVKINLKVLLMKIFCEQTKEDTLTKRIQTTHPPFTH